MFHESASVPAKLRDRASVARPEPLFASKTSSATRRLQAQQPGWRTNSHFGGQTRMVVKIVVRPIAKLSDLVGSSLNAVDSSGKAERHADRGEHADVVHREVFRAGQFDERPVDHLVQLRRLAPQARSPAICFRIWAPQVVVPRGLG